MDIRVVILIFLSITFLYDRCIVMSASVGSGRDRKVLLRQCDMPTIKNGLTKLRQRGKLVKFQCYKGYTLIGSLYAGCIGGKWDTPIPVCAKSGCVSPTPPANGFIMMERQGIMATFFCKEHYKPAGVQTAYCDGTEWDRPIGTCRSTSESSSRWCDFEVDDLCGWTHDDTHDFEWKRVVGVDNLKKFRTGPQHDHTTMKSNAGHYMLLESVNQLPEDRARFLSPVYLSNMSRNTCFKFFYHMYGATVGTLRVYVKPMSIDMDTLIQDQSYLYFEISGNQKNEWHEAVFPIKEITEDFQIVLDGSAGNNHLSDIAIDDVVLLEEDQCRDNDKEMKTTEYEEPLAYDIQSCKNRCDEKTSATTEVVNTGGKRYIITCDCHLECEDLMTCCPDYRSLCAFGTTYFDLEDEKDITTQESVINYEKDRKQVRTFELKTTEIYSTLPKNTSTTTKMTTYANTAVPKLFTTKGNMNNVVTSTISTIEQYPVVVSTENINFQDQNSSTSEELNVKYMKWDTNVIALLLPKKHEKILPFTTAHEWLINKKTNELSLIPSWLTIILSTFSVACTTLAAIVSIIYYRKHYGPENYKKNVEQKNATRNANEEFSEVRYLTSDEQLDFSMQTTETVTSQQNGRE